MLFHIPHLISKWSHPSVTDLPILYTGWHNVSMDRTLWSGELPQAADVHITHMRYFEEGDDRKWYDEIYAGYAGSKEVLLGTHFPHKKEFVAQFGTLIATISHESSPAFEQEGARIRVSFEKDGQDYWSIAYEAGGFDFFYRACAVVYRAAEHHMKVMGEIGYRFPVVNGKTRAVLYADEGVFVDGRLIGTRLSKRDEYKHQHGLLSLHGYEVGENIFRVNISRIDKHSPRASFFGPSQDKCWIETNDYLRNNNWGTGITLEV